MSHALLFGLNEVSHVTRPSVVLGILLDPNHVNYLPVRILMG